jgi:hypothetical protein
MEFAEVLNDKQFAQLMAALDIEQPSNEALAHLKVPQHKKPGGRQPWRLHHEKP